MRRVAIALLALPCWRFAMMSASLNCFPPRRHCSGFTPIELSMALVVIGLLVGGIFVGQR